MNFKTKSKLFLKNTFPNIVYKYLAKKNPYLIERNNIFNHLGIDTIFDVGANIGLYAHTVRNLGFKGKIVSFEPQNSAFDSLKNLARKDSNWFVRNYALGSENTSSSINISHNSISSSILDQADVLNDFCPDAAYIDKQTIDIKRLDDIISEFCDSNSKVFVKIDTQGFEKEVILGSQKVLRNILAFQLELPLIEIYKNENTFFELIDLMKSINYRLVKIEPGWSDPKTGYTVEVDGIFIKSDIVIN